MMELHERAPQFFRILVAMIILATIATALRVYVRIKIVKSFGKDDYLMVAALVSLFTTDHADKHVLTPRAALLHHVHHLRPGWHPLRHRPTHVRTDSRELDEGAPRTSTTSPPSFQQQQQHTDNGGPVPQYWWLCYAAYTSTMMLAKTSIGFFLLRVTIERVYIWIIYAAMTLTGITGVVFCFVTVLQCRPVSFFWTKAVDATTGTCLDIDIIIALTYFYSAVSALCDFTFGLLPVVMLWNLNMSRSTKIAVAPILSMACIASAGVLVRTAYVRDFRDPDFLCTYLPSSLPPSAPFPFPSSLPLPPSPHRPPR
ncbi:hypothetical protein BK809_0006935 [Diplodia seriata]|uniref:Rhodopsin domain-containing protein n=1 Tax=Diplodia seriata TaxID=420778 RepID=A0A1S8B519_9PEZI|nr:hypothetical protein BK809_0006935 [Diplodia seriata]